MKFNIVDYNFMKTAVDMAVHSHGINTDWRIVDTETDSIPYAVVTFHKNGKGVGRRIYFNDKFNHYTMSQKLIDRALGYFGIVNESETEIGMNHSMQIKNVIFNDPATIVFWEDGTKTVVKVQDGDVFDPEKGLAMAISKKALGNKGNYFNEIKKWTEKHDEEMIECSELLKASVLFENLKHLLRPDGDK